HCIVIAPCFKCSKIDSIESSMKPITKQLKSVVRRPVPAPARMRPAGRNLKPVTASRNAASCSPLRSACATAAATLRHVSAIDASADPSGRTCRYFVDQMCRESSSSSIPGLPGRSDLCPVFVLGYLADRLHELGQRAHPELAHDPRAVQLDSALAHAEVHCDDLVRLAADDAMHDLGLALRQRLDALADLPLLAPRGAARLVLLERLVDAVDQLLIAERFLDEVGRASFHRGDGHRDVAVTGNEDQRCFGVRLEQALLQLEAAHAGHPDVADDAGVAIRI